MAGFQFSLGSGYKTNKTKATTSKKKPDPEDALRQSVDSEPGPGRVVLVVLVLGQ